MAGHPESAHQVVRQELVWAALARERDTERVERGVARADETQVEPDDARYLPREPRYDQVSVRKLPR